jgi:hypothetical protein
MRRSQPEALSPDRRQASGREAVSFPTSPRPPSSRGGGVVGGELGGRCVPLTHFDNEVMWKHPEARTVGAVEASGCPQDERSPWGLYSTPHRRWIVLGSTLHGFCPLHRIGYNRDFDATCPQCVLQRVQPPEQLDFDATKQQPLNATGKLLDRRTLQEVA